MWKQQFLEELLRPETYLITPLLQKYPQALQDPTLSNDVAVLSQQTVQTCKTQQKTLQAAFAEKLQLLSILTHLHAATTYSLALLARHLAASHEDTLRLLLKASIAKLLSVSIDEPSGTIHVHSCCVRERDVPSNPKSLQGRIGEIQRKNEAVSNSLSGIVGLIEPASKSEVRGLPSPKLGQGMRRPYY